DSGDHRDLPSFPTRRSSDLQGGVNFAFSDASLVTSADGEILIALKPVHASTTAYAEKLRTILGKRFPDLTVFFQPADIVSQILRSEEHTSELQSRFDLVCRL